MRKVNLVTTLSLTVVMLAAMTGLAVATEIDVDPQVGLQLIPGEFVKTTVSITDIPIPYQYNQRRLRVTGPDWSHINDLTFRVDSTETPGFLNHYYTPNAQNYVLDVYIKAAPGTEGNTYTLWYTDVDSSAQDMVMATVQGTAIPEFTTIALPVASILGLLFYFNHRKHRKE